MNERRRMTYRDYISLAVLPVVLGIGGFFGSRLYASIDDLEKVKLDKEIYYHDQQAINERLDRQFKAQDAKSDLIIQLLQEHESESKERDNKVLHHAQKQLQLEQRIENGITQ